MGKDFRYRVYSVKYRLKLLVGGYEDQGRFVTAHQIEVDANDGSFLVPPEIRAGLVEAALAVLLSDREGKGV